MGGDGGWVPCDVAAGCYVAVRGEVARVHARVLNPVDGVSPAASLRVASGYSLDAGDCEWLAARLGEAAAAIRAAEVPA